MHRDHYHGPHQEVKLKIQHISVRNFKGVIEADLALQHVTEITGKNGQGKTSLLEAIQAGFEGGGAHLIRRGADKAEIFIDMDELSLARSITQKGNQPARITTADKMKPTSPQKYLSDLVKGFNFSSIDFYLLKPDKQRAYLLNLAPIKLTEEQVRNETSAEIAEIDYNTHGLDVAGQVQKWFEARRGEAKMRRVDADNASIVSASDIPDGFEQDLHALGGADAARAKWEEMRINATRQADEDRQILATAEHNRGTREQLEKQLEEAKARVREIQATIDNLPGSGDLSHVEERYREHRRVHDAMVESLADLAEWTAHQLNVQIVQELDTEIKALDAAVKHWRLEVPARLLAEADLPIPGLTFDGGRVLVNGIDFNEQSDGERLLMSLDIAKALNKDAKVPIIFCNGAEQLDPDNRAAFLAAAEADDKYQWIVTTVTGREGKPGSVVAQEGLFIDERGDHDLSS